VEGEEVVPPQLTSGAGEDALEEYINQDVAEEEKPIELIDPMGDWAVKYAASEWRASGT